MNPMQIIQLLQKGRSPQQLAIELLQTRMGNNPIGQNLLALVQAGKTQDVEQVVRNLAAQRGIDFDKEFNSFKQMLGIKEEK